MILKSKRNIHQLLLIIIIVSMSISPAFAIGSGGRNLLLIGLMGLSPLLIFFSVKKFYFKDSWLLLFMASLILCPLLFNPESMRWSTVMYAFMFCLTFIAYKQLLYENIFSIRHYNKLLMYLIYAYCLVLVIQQFSVLTGLPIFNLGNYDIDEPWKLNSLAAEPSHSARIVALLMYSYLTSKELVIKHKYKFKNNLKEDKWIWVAFFWVMVTMGSGTAFFFILIVLLKFISFRNLLPLIIIICIIILLASIIGDSSFDRTYKFFIATLTLNEEVIIEADHSASFRIVPVIVLAKMINITTIEGWFGAGVDNVSTFLYKYMPGGGDNITGGGLFAMAKEYGFVSFLFFISFSIIHSCSQKDHLSLIFWFMLVLLYGVNNQILWVCIILLFTNKYFYNIETIKTRYNYVNP